MSQCREFSEIKVVGKKWLIRTGCLWGWQAGGREMPHPENLVGYSFVIKGQVGRGRRASLSFLSGHHISIISSSSRLGRGVFFSLYGQARSVDDCFLCVQITCPRIMNLLSSLGRTWVSCHHCFIVLGMSLASVAWFCCSACLFAFVVKQTCFLE